MPENKPFSIWKSLKEYKNLIIGFIAINLLAYIAVPLILTCPKISFVSYKGMGEIGDTIGGTVGPIIAIIAAILTFVAYLEQIKLNREQMKQFSEQEKQFNLQMELQKTQFNESLEEQKRQFDIQLKEQDKITQRQRFESHFFELLRIYENTVNNLEIEVWQLQPLESENYKEAFINYTKYGYTHVVELNGRKVFKQLYQEMERTKKYFPHDITNMIIAYEKCLDGIEMAEKEDINSISSVKDTICQPEREISSYFRILVFILNFIINSSAINETEKYFYIGILTSSFSTYENIILFHHILSIHGNLWNDADFFTRWQVPPMYHGEPLTMVEEHTSLKKKQLFSKLRLSPEGKYLGEGIFHGQYIFQFAEEDAKNKQNESK